MQISVDGGWAAAETVSWDICFPDYRAVAHRRGMMLTKNIYIGADKFTLLHQSPTSIRRTLGKNISRKKIRLQYNIIIVRRHPLYTLFRCPHCNIIYYIIINSTVVLRWRI